MHETGLSRYIRDSAMGVADSTGMTRRLDREICSANRIALSQSPGPYNGTLPCGPLDRSLVHFPLLFSSFY